MSFAVQQSVSTASRCVQLRKSAFKARPLVARQPKKAVISRNRVSVSASAKTDEIMESLKTLTLLEASELVSQMEEVFGISTAAMAAPAAAPGGAPGAPAEAAEEQTEFDLVLEAVEDSSNRIKVIKVVRALTGLGLKEAKGMVEGAPKALKEGVSKADCEEGLKQLEEAGAKASIK